MGRPGPAHMRTYRRRRLLVFTPARVLMFLLLLVLMLTSGLIEDQKTGLRGIERGGRGRRVLLRGRRKVRRRRRRINIDRIAWLRRGIHSIDFAQLTKGRAWTARSVRKDPLAVHRALPDFGRRRLGTRRGLCCRR